jgi:Gas vesicle protein G
VFLIDSVLLSPFHGVLWIAQQIHDAAHEQVAADAETLTEELRCLYLDLERGQITEEQFAAHEQRLLDRLDALRDSETTQDEGEDDETERTDEDDSGPEGTT